jgi:hypothetical protein
MGVVGLVQSTTRVTNQDGVETTLLTYTLPASTMSRDGDSIFFEFYGDFSGAADTNLFIRLGGQPIFDSGAIDPAATVFSVTGRLIRKGAVLQAYFSSLVSNGISVNLGGEMTVDLTVDNDLVVSGLATGAASIALAGTYLTLYIVAP